MIKGSCLCGGVAFEADKNFDFRYCHCSRCRKARGAACASNVLVRPEDFRWVRGKDLVIDFKLPTAARFGNAFCKICGSPMPRLVVARQMCVVPAGALDEDPGVRPSCHIFAGSKAPWHEITDQLPQYDTYPQAS